MIRVYKCQHNECKNLAMWKTGTWNLCDECAKDMLTGKDYKLGLRGEMVYTGFGSTVYTGIREIEKSTIEMNSIEAIKQISIEIKDKNVIRK